MGHLQAEDSQGSWLRGRRGSRHSSWIRDRSWRPTHEMSCSLESGITPVKPVCKTREYFLVASFSSIKFNELGSAPRKSQVRISEGKRNCCFFLSLKVEIFWDHSCCSHPLRTLAGIHIQVYIYEKSTSSHLPRMVSQDKQLARKITWAPNLTSRFTNYSSLLPVQFRWG